MRYVSRFPCLALLPHVPSWPSLLPYSPYPLSTCVMSSVVPPSPCLVFVIIAKTVANVSRRTMLGLSIYRVSLISGLTPVSVVVAAV